MTEHLFILPFLAGTTYLLITLAYKFTKWISGLSKIDKLRLFQSLRSVRTFRSMKEAFVEGLLHRAIFARNPVLGYMHASLAFGWFLLIVVGHIEAMVQQGTIAVPLYLPIFFRYFEDGSHYLFAQGFAFTMDLLLLAVLSGVALALIKRFRKSLFGLKRTTKLRTGDRIALGSLWFIFPLRLLAESATAGLHGNGSFLTGSFGALMSGWQALPQLETPIWAAYSLSLGLFFVFLPNSRYMHIPTEILFIFVRNAGVKLKKRTNTYTDIQVHSCSRCGLCLDNCQMSVAGIKDSQSVYLLKTIRNNNLDDEQLFNCLLCGKCQNDCPVGIETIGLRITQRIESTRQYNSSYEYLQKCTSKHADVVYFAGCMTHLAPGIIKAMKKIFEAAGEDYWFLDEEKAPCCGRPLMQAGQYDAAAKLIANNTATIIGSGARILVVSCPICYKVFKEDYDLGTMEVVFHAEYILQLVQDKKLTINMKDTKILYHDPCELGRLSGIYEQPRELLRQTGSVLKIEEEKEKAFCCGGSLGNLKIRQFERDMIRVQAVNTYLSYSPDLLVTACPKCKKTFARSKNIIVKDIAEVVADALLK